MTAITTAVRLLREAATELKKSHTLNGDWGNEHDALTAYNAHIAAAADLERIAPQCLAQIQEPAQPVCWIRFCSDGSTEGPIMHSQICEARKTSGAWTPLYAGAAPATVVLQREYPAINPKDFDSDSDLWCYIDAWRHSKPGKESGENAYLVCGHIQRLMRAYFDLGRKPATTAPALEAPAASAGDLALIIAALEHSQPQMSHYAEPRERHTQALTAARRLAAAPQAPAAPAVDAETIHLQDLKNALAECKELRQQLTLMDEQQAGTVWRWQADGQHQLDTMGNRMGVLIYACDLRALLAGAALSQAARDVLAERQRQISAEGYEPEADDMYESGELARAAATYALLATGDEGWRVEDNWPWGMSTLKRAEPRRMLEKAGALILADMERIDRAAQAAAQGDA